MKTINNKLFKLLFSLVLMLTLACSKAEEFNKDCDLCQQLNQKQVETSLINFIYNDSIANISKEAVNQLMDKKEALHHGFKIIECGCNEDHLIYHLWCANDETFSLEVKLINGNHFEIIGIRKAEFSHP